MASAIDIVSSDQLATADQLPATPFYLRIDVDKEELWLCQKIYRHLPKKRLVLKLHRASTTVVGKLFYRKKDYDREIRGQKWLRNKGFLTPKVSHLREVDSQHSYKSWLVVYEHIDTVSVATAMLDMTIGAQQKLLLRCCQIVAKMHALGLYQDDIHLDNFLYDHDKIWIVDSASIKNNNAPLSKKLALNNLGLLLAQIPTEKRPNIAEACRLYGDIYDYFIIKSAELTSAIMRMQQSRWSHYKKKLSRNCTEFWVAKNNTILTIVRKDHLSDELLNKLKNVDQWMEQGSQLKGGNTATVVKVEGNGKSYVIKRYNIKNWRHAISRSLRPTRGWAAWHNGNYLRFNEISTPLPVALVEERFGFIRKRAWLITDYANGIDLLTAARSTTTDTNLLDPGQLPSLMADLIAQLVTANTSHGDMKATNFIVTEKGIQIIDLDAMQIHPSHAKTTKAIKLDIDRLLRNWDELNIKQNFTAALQATPGIDFITDK
ncbi:MAG: tRNA A-37 threonylcarbamoyl transferase component Bud32 [Pseudomonadales bacterium]|jgi:tRNA A-37 threonylcarbamoyl transferase component Bud32